MKHMLNRNSPTEDNAQLSEMCRGERECAEGVATRAPRCEEVLTVQHDEGGAMLIFP